MKFKQAVTLLKTYEDFADLCYELANLKEGKNKNSYRGGVYAIELGVGGIVVRFEDYHCRERETHSVTLLPIAFDDKEAWLKQLEEEREEKKRQDEQLRQDKLQAYQEQRRQEYEKLKKEFGDG